MSKKKKKGKKLTAGQRLALRFGAAKQSALTAAGSVPAKLKTGLPQAAEKLYRAADAFVRLKRSAALIAVVMLGLMLLTYSNTIYNYLFGNFPYYTTRMIQFYLIDFNVGFVSRALVGHIISLFTDKVSFGLIIRLTQIVVWLSLIAQAVLAALVFKKAWLRKSPLICVLCAAFVLSHLTVMPNVINFGILDTYNLLLAILYIYVSDTKAAYVLTPLICFTGIILHYEFVISYLAVILSIELYYIMKNKKGRKLRAAVLCFTVLGSAALAVYLMFFSKINVKMTADELYRYMRAKYTDFYYTDLFEDYFNYYIYGDYQGVNYSDPADFVRFLVNYALERINYKSLLLYFINVAPAFGLIEYFWAYIIKRTEKRMRLPYLVFMLQPLVLVAALIVSTDTSRWAGANWFSNFMLLFTVLHNDEPLLTQAAEKATDKRWKKAALAASLLAAYAAGTYIYRYK